MISDERLVQRLGEDPEGGLRVLLQRHWGTAFRVGLQVARDPMAAEDAAQDAFLRVLDRASSFDPERAFRPWFVRIVANCARDRVKARQRRARHERRAAKPEITGSAEGLDAETCDLLWSALGELKAEQRMAVSLHYLEGLSFREVAEALECPEGTAASRCRRGLKALRRELTPALSAAPLPALLAGLEIAAPRPPAASALARKGAAGAAGAFSAKALALVLVGASLLAGGGWASGLFGGGDAPADPPVAEAPAPEGPASSAGVDSGDAAGEQVPADVGPVAGGPRTDAPAASGADADADAVAVAEGGLRVTVRQQGAPLAGVALECTRVRFGTADEPLVRGEVLRRETDDQGVALLELPAGMWALRVGAPPALGLGPGSTSPLALGGEPFAGVLLGTTHNPFGDGLPWHAVPGQVRELSVDVLPFTVVHGEVVREVDGAPVPDAEVALGGRWQARSDAAGRFALLAPPDAATPGGGREVTAEAPGYAFGSAPMGPDRPLRITLRPGVELRLRVLHPDGRPAANCMLNLSGPSGMQLQRTTDAEGRLRLADLTPDRGPGFALVYAALLPSDADAHYTQLLAHDGYEHVIRLPDAVRLQGTVRLDGVPLGDVAVAFERRGVVHGPVRTLLPDGETKDALGEFVLPGLGREPGWLLVGCDDANEGDAWPAPSLLDAEDSPTRRHALHAEWIEPGEAPLEVALRPAAASAVHVRHAVGGAAARATVRVRPLDGPAEGRPVLAEATSDVDGDCELPTLAGGVSYAVEARLADGRTAAGRVTGGQPCELVLPGAPLGPPGRVRLRVLDPEGAPVEFNAKIRLLSVADPSLEVGHHDMLGGVLEFDEDEPEEEPAPGTYSVVTLVPGEVWVEANDYGLRAVTRVRVEPGGEVDAGTLRLRPLVEVPLTLAFEFGAVKVDELLVEWTDPQTGIAMQWYESMPLAPGPTQQPLRLPAGEVTLRASYRDQRDPQRTALPPLTVRVDPKRPAPVVLEIGE